MLVVQYNRFFHNFDGPVLRRGYVIALEEDTTYIGADRVPIRNVYRTSVRPKSPHARFFVFRYRYDNDPRRGVASVQPGAGCGVELFEENDEGVIYVVLKFDPNSPDEMGRCTFTWAIELQTEVPSEPWYDVHTRSLIQQQVARVQFQPPALPSRISWFRGTDPFDTLLAPPPAQLLQLNSTNFYFHEFYDLENEACGLAWKWADQQVASEG